MTRPTRTGTTPSDRAQIRSSAMRRKIGSSAVALATALTLLASPAAAIADYGYKNCGNGRAVETDVYGANTHFHDHNGNYYTTYSANWRHSYKTYWLVSVDWMGWATNSGGADTARAYCKVNPYF